MGKDNQDYFKRAGRSIGPAGPLRQFKAALSQERAVLRRDQEHRIPSERPVTGVRQAGWLHPPQGEEPAHGDGPTPEGASPKPAHPDPVGAAGNPRTPGAGQHERTGAPTRQGASSEASSPPDPGGLAELESRNQEPPLHELEPREYEAPYGFGIPASEEAALGRERAPHERLGRETGPSSPQRPRLGERMARRYPQSFRLLGRGADWIDRPIRRAFARMHALSEIAKRA